MLILTNAYLIILKLVKTTAPQAYANGDLSRTDQPTTHSAHGPKQRGRDKAQPALGPTTAPSSLGETIFESDSRFYLQ